MKDEQQSSHQYALDFNKGYTIGRDYPELAEKLEMMKDDGDRTQGLRDGQKQFDQDKIQSRSHRPGFLKDQSAEKQASPEKSLDKDIEPEMD
jgi:hypothetical protein